MKEFDSSRGLVRFEGFQLDLGSGELLSDAGKIFRLSEQPFRILTLLLRRPGEVLTREEIRKQLWPNDTIVEFEHSISAAMNRLRQALGDSAERPHYIETLARRGYRWMVSVDYVDSISFDAPDAVSLKGAAGNLIGRKVAHFRVLAILGGGGMGVVYKAEDLKLGRPVALKFLPEELASDPTTLERFEREARAASALNHPNICTIYGTDEHEGHPFIVMELLEGKSLTELISLAGGNLRPLPRLEEFLDIAIQVSEGLEAAHAMGIVHRDIKPGNIFVTSKRSVKVLDFGLAKKTSGKVAVGVQSLTTVSMTEEQITTPGTTLGTIAYMSPEQARGEEVDARSDLFSFGAVLYQMATGRQAFSGNTSAVVFDAILNKTPPPPRQLFPELPEILAGIIDKALEKDRDMRYQSAAEMLADLKRLKRQTGSHASLGAGGGRTVPPHRRLQLRRIALLGLLAIVILAPGFWYLAPLPAPKVLAYTPLTHDRGRKFPPMVTDGTRLYFMMPKKTGWTIGEVSTSGGETAAIDSHFDDIQLADISPNGSELLIGQFGDEDVPIYILPLPAGLPRRVGDILAHDASWSPNGDQIVYARGDELFLAKPDGSESRRLVTLAAPASWTRWSPDGRVLRFTVNDLSLWEVGSDGTGLHQLLPDGSSPPEQCCGHWTPDGNYFLFESTSRDPTGSTPVTLWAIREKRGFLRNPKPTQLTTGQTNIFGSVPSRDGKKLFATQGATRGQLVRYDARSQQFVPYLSGISAIRLAFSKDGQWVAYSSFPDGIVWRSKVDGTERLQLSPSSLVPAGAPQWSPDGKQIAFSANPGAKKRIYVVSADGGTPREVTKGEAIDFYPSWSRDGNSLFFGSMAAVAIYQVNLKTNQVTTLPGSKGMWFPILSPDYNYIAALSSTNHLKLFDLKGQKWTELTQTQADYPSWSHDGKYVYFSSTAGREPAFYRVQITNHKLELVTSLKDVNRPTSGTFASWTGLTPDDFPLALRDISNYEIYALDLQLP